MIESRIQTIDPDIVISIFRRYKVKSEVVKPFLDFSETVRSIPLQAVTLNSDEEPTLLSFTNPDCWLLLTTERLIWQRDQQVQELRYSELETLDIDRSHIPSQGLRYKTEGKEIEIKTCSRQKITIHVGESGAVRLALLSALGWILQKIKS